MISYGTKYNVVRMIQKHTIDLLLDANEISSRNLDHNSHHFTFRRGLNQNLLYISLWYTYLA